MTSTSRVHPDDMVRRCLWTASAHMPSATRIATTVPRCAVGCTRPGCTSNSWTLKTFSGHARNKRRLPEPEAVCILCGQSWDTWDEVNHMTTGAPGSGITNRGRWTRYIHVRSRRSGAGPRSNEERMFGDTNIWELYRLREVFAELHRSRLLYWQIRTYVAYVTNFEGVRGRGGERALATWANGRARGQHRVGSWPRAPFTWNRDRVALLVEQGRGAWAERLVAADLIEGGEWWQEHPA